MRGRLLGATAVLRFLRADQRYSQKERRCSRNFCFRPRQELDEQQVALLSSPLYRPGLTELPGPRGCKLAAVPHCESQGRSCRARFPCGLFGRCLHQTVSLRGPSGLCRALPRSFDMSRIYRGSARHFERPSPQPRRERGVFLEYANNSRSKHVGVHRTSGSQCPFARRQTDDGRIQRWLKEDFAFGRRDFISRCSQNSVRDSCKTDRIFSRFSPSGALFSSYSSILQTGTRRRI